VQYENYQINLGGVMSKRSLWVGSLARAIGIISAVIVVATGVTFAALQSPQASLLNNTIASATADLRIGTSSSSFAATRTGFDFKDVVPGSAAYPAVGNSVFLKNYGNANLGLKMAISSIPINTDNVDLAKASLVITRVDTSTSQTLTIQSLVDSYPTHGLSLTDSLLGGVVAEYKLQVVMAPDAFTGQSATVGDIDIVFSGTGVN
jgi:hypothetical protein